VGTPPAFAFLCHTSDRDCHKCITLHLTCGRQGDEEPESILAVFVLRSSIREVNALPITEGILTLVTLA